MATKRTEYAEKGQTSTPVNKIAKLIAESSAWLNSRVKNDSEVDTRIEEYFNLCVSKGELPMFETLALYLGIDDETLKKWMLGDGCSTRRREALQYALTRMKAIEGKGLYSGDVPTVPSIWRSKQYFGYKEPNNDITLHMENNPLKELPSGEGILEAYLGDFAEEEEDQK